jgi:hypothetical protein
MCSVSTDCWRLRGAAVLRPRFKGLRAPLAAATRHSARDFVVSTKTLLTKATEMTSVK